MKFIRVHKYKKYKKYSNINTKKLIIININKT